MGFQEKSIIFQSATLFKSNISSCVQRGQLEKREKAGFIRHEHEEDPDTEAEKVFLEQKSKSCIAILDSCVKEIVQAEENDLNLEGRQPSRYAMQ